MRVFRFVPAVLVLLLSGPAGALAQEVGTWGAYARLAGASWRSSYPTADLVSMYALAADGRSLTRTTLHGKQLSIYEVETLTPSAGGGLEGVIRRHDGSTVRSRVKLEADGRTVHEADAIRVTLVAAEDRVTQSVCFAGATLGCTDAALEKLPADQAAQLGQIRAKWPILFGMAGRSFTADHDPKQLARFAWIEPGRSLREVWHSGKVSRSFIVTLRADGLLEKKIEGEASVLSQSAWFGRPTKDGGLDWVAPGLFGGTSGGSTYQNWVPGEDSHSAAIMSGFKPYPYRVIAYDEYARRINAEQSAAPAALEEAAPSRLDDTLAQVRRSLLERATQPAAATAVAVTTAPVQAAAVPAPQRPDTPAATSGRRLALVIGNDGYRNVPRLANARADAQAVAASLGRMGFAVTLRTDLDERAFKQALRTFRAEIQGGDQVVVYFAGHGVQLGGANYLLPVDIRSEGEDQVRDEALPLQRVLDDFAERRAGFMLAIVDACRDNPFKTTGRSIGGRGLAPSTAATGQMIIFSAGSGQQALDKLGPQDKNPNGLFTRVFLQEMEKADTSVDRLLRNVRNEVVRLARTVGHDQTPALYDQAVGDFYLRTRR